MRYKEITESNIIGDNAYYENVGQIIKRDCQPYINAVSNPIGLFRGVYGPDSGDSFFFKKRVRLDGRQSVAMPDEYHLAFNNAFQQILGAPFRDSALSTGDRYYATDFGPLHIIFPIGKFAFAWSPVVRDLNDLTDRDKLPELDRIPAFLKKMKYSNTNLDQGIKSNHEIMVRCSSYYALNVEMFNDDRPLSASMVAKIVGEQLR